MVSRIIRLTCRTPLRNFSFVVCSHFTRSPVYYKFYNFQHSNKKILWSVLTKNFSKKITGPLDAVTYESVCEETLESLSDYIEELISSKNDAPDSDVSYGDGVLTVKMGNSRGTYVINKQTPNKQIWLSSPISGPKRYDFVDGRWIYKHDGVALHDLLTKEFNQLLKTETNFSRCSYG